MSVLYASCDQQLPDVPLHVLRCVKQHSQYRRRQLLAAYRARVVQYRSRHCAELVQRALHLCVECAEQIIDTASDIRSLPFVPEYVPLLAGQGLAAGIREQAINHPSHVLQMKAN
jgi:hypothetical protein